MALPPELATVNVYGTYVNLDGGPTVGYLVFQPSPVILKATASREFVVPTTMQVNLDETGHFTIVLPACDDPDVTPSDWTYQVTEAFGSRRVYSIEVHVASGTDQNIYDLAPVALANGTYYLQGDRGPAGPDILTTTGQPAPSVGDDGDKAFDLAAGIVYVRTGTTWDSGTKMGTDQPAGNAVARRDASGGAAFNAVALTTQVNAGDATRKDYVNTQDAATLASAKSYADSQDTAAKVGPTFTGPVQVTGNQTVTGSQVVGVDQTVGGALTVSGQTSLGAATVSGTPTNAADVVRKDYVDTQVTAESTARTNADTNLQNQITSNTTAIGTKVQLAGDLGGTASAPQVTSGANHTHTSAQVSDATSSNVAATVVKRSSANAFAVTSITGLSAPTTTDNAANKGYVDTADALAVKLATKNLANGYVGLDASGNASLSGQLTVSSTATLSGSATVGSTLSVTGRITAPGKISIFNNGDVSLTMANDTAPLQIGINGDVQTIWDNNEMYSRIWNTTTGAYDLNTFGMSASAVVINANANGGADLRLSGTQGTRTDNAVRKDYVDGKFGTKTTMTYQNSWSTVSTFTALSATQVGNILFLTGVVKNSATITPQSTVCTLPTAMRPTATHTFPAIAGDSLARIDIGSDGLVRLVMVAGGTLAAGAYLAINLSFDVTG